MCYYITTIDTYIMRSSFDRLLLHTSSISIALLMQHVHGTYDANVQPTCTVLLANLSLASTISLARPSLSVSLFLLLLSFFFCLSPQFVLRSHLVLHDLDDDLVDDLDDQPPALSRHATAEIEDAGSPFGFQLSPPLHSGFPELKNRLIL